mgnify:CR=1 FL=1
MTHACPSRFYPTEGGMTTGTLPLRIGAWRCPDCLATWTRAAGGLRAVNLEKMVSLVPDAAGFYSCPCGSILRFNWEEGHEPLEAPAAGPA